MEKRVVNIQGIPTVITITGSGKILLCLHGWGGSHESFTELRAALADDPVCVLAPDLPGFGESGEPPMPWGVGEYVEFVQEMMRHLGSGIWDPGSGMFRWDFTQVQESGIFVLGHSFGGRIAIKWAAQCGQSVMVSPSNHDACRMKHLFLCAAAGVRQRISVQKKVFFIFAKVGKKFLRATKLHLLEEWARAFLYKLLRVHDYERASARMKETMVRVIDEDLSPMLQDISVPTDLFWGEDDRTTLLRDGELMHEKIQGSVLHTFAGVRHGVHRDRAHEIAEVIRGMLDSSH